MERIITPALKFNAIEQTLFVNGKKMHLTTKESGLLEVLFDNQNEVIEKENIVLKVWGNNNIGSIRSLDVYMTKVRKKLLPLNPEVSILTVHKKGYRLIVPHA